MKKFFFLFGVVWMFLQCVKTPDKHQRPSGDAPPAIQANLPFKGGFNEYWYAGKAELTSYDVVQERYGETRKAEQINVFVTEDFSRAKQVKLDEPLAAGADRVPILKLNALRRFETGIYDYSLMQSVFTPVDGTPTLKATASVQDWCGQVFMQTNLENGAYRMKGFSYFESEGDIDKTLPGGMLEDELWSRLRLGPEKIKTGKITIIPSSIYSRLRHRPLQASQADLAVENKGPESRLVLRYLDIPRELRITYQTEFPHRILGWEEIHDGKNASKGTLKAVRMSSYWAEHDNAHAALRDSLRLEFK